MASGRVCATTVTAPLLPAISSSARATMVATLVGISIPAFVLGPILILVFALRLGWLPVAGWLGPRYLVLPALVLAGRPAALIARRAHKG